MGKPLSISFIVTLIIIFASQTISNAEENTEEFNAFETEYSTIYYKQKGDLDKFFWRISGTEINIYEYAGLAKSRVDRLVERVQSILDIYPDEFHVTVYLYPKHTKGPIAFYSDKANTIIIYVDKVTDGVLAHEISHAILSAYYKVPPPHKISEILSQYVDRHLWGE